MSKPALWWSWLLADVATETAGEVGSFKKRPAAVILNLGGGGQISGQTLVLQGISRLHRQMNRHQTGQELAFLEELRTSLAVDVGRPGERALNDDPPTDQWLAAQLRRCQRCTKTDPLLPLGFEGGFERSSQR